MATCFITPSSYAGMFTVDDNHIYVHYLAGSDVELITESVNKLIQETNPEGSITLDVPYVVITRGLHHAGCEDLLMRYCDHEHIYLVGKYKSLDRRKDDIRELQLKVVVKDIFISHSYKEAV